MEITLKPSQQLKVKTGKVVHTTEGHIFTHETDALIWFVSLTENEEGIYISYCFNCEESLDIKLSIQDFINTYDVIDGECDPLFNGWTAPIAKSTFDGGASVQLSYNSIPIVDIMIDAELNASYEKLTSGEHFDNLLSRVKATIDNSGFEEVDDTWILSALADYFILMFDSAGISFVNYFEYFHYKLPDEQ